MVQAAKAKEPSDERAQLTDRERETFQELFDLFIPDDFNVLGYDKEKVSTRLMKGVEDDIAIVRLKMRKVLKSLKKCYEEEEHEEKEKGNS